MQSPRLVLIPGMGVDGRLFNVQRAAFPNLESPAWLEPESPKETLAHYAERLAASVPRASDPATPIVVGGLSMGGMLALEMAPHMNARAIALMATCDHPSAVLPLLAFGDRVGRVTPRAIIALGKSIAPMFVGRGGVPPEHRQLLQAMLRDISVDFLRWAGRAITSWPGVEKPAAPVFHAHGTRDWVIPMSRLRRPPTHVIKDGAHVLSMSHPREVESFLSAVLSEARAQARASEGSNNGSPTN